MALTFEGFIEMVVMGRIWARHDFVGFKNRILFFVIRSGKFGFW